MAETTGIQVRGGFRREAIVTAQTWPAAAPALVTDLLPILGWAPNDGVTTAGVAEVQAGGYGLARQEIRSILPTLGLSMTAVYQGQEALWACALGYMAKRLGGVVMPEQLAAGVYRHLYEVDPTLSTSALWDATADGFQGGELSAGQRRVRRGTLALDMQTSVWEWLSGMIAGLALQCDAAGTTLVLDLVAHSVGRASSVNTSATLAAALPNAGPRVLLTDLAWRIAPYSDSTPLGDADRIKPMSWTVRLDNQLASAAGPETGTAPLEYDRSGSLPAAVTVTFMLPRRTADTWQARWGANTVLMAQAQWASERLVAAGQPYRLACYLPSCQVTNASMSSSGAGIPGDIVQLIASSPAGAPAGFPTTQHRGPLQVEVVSGVAQHPLL